MANLRAPRYHWIGGILVLHPRPDIPPPNATVRLRSLLGRSVFTTPPVGGQGFANFVVDSTRPTVANSFAPAADALDNTGCSVRFTDLPVINGNVSIANGQTVSNRWINGDVTMVPGASLIDCVVKGSSPANPSRPGMINGTGGTVRRVTLLPAPSALLDPNYQTAPAAGRATYKNNMHISGGPWTIVQVDMSRCVDGIHYSSGNSTIEVAGCLFHEKVVWDCDPAQASANPNPLWSHGDDIQILGGTSTWNIHGNDFQSFFACDGVTWSGGSWGVGTASGGTYGTPATPLNAGYLYTRDLSVLVGRGNWSNGVNATGSAKFNGRFCFNWVDGVNAGSGNFQLGTGGAPHTLFIEGQRVGLGGKVNASGKLYLFQWPASTALTVGPTGFGSFLNQADVPASLRGDAIAGSFASGYNLIVPAS